MKKTSFFDEIQNNKRKSLFLILVVSVFLLVIVYVFGQVFYESAVFIYIFGVLFIVIDVGVSYYSGDKIVLSSVKAKPAEGSKYIHLNNAVEGLCIAAGIPKPKIYVFESKDINAFATGRSPETASIAVTTGALENLNRSELEGVIAHELSHVKNYDIRFATIVAVLVGLIAILSHMFLRSFRFRGSKRDRNDSSFVIVFLIAIVLSIFAPIVSRLVQLAISRKREFAADASAVQFTRYPRGLINALKKIKQENIRPEKKISRAVAPLFISDPFLRLGRTHPPIDKRIEALERM